MPERDVLPALRVPMERFEPMRGSFFFSDVTFIVPRADQRYAVGAVIYVSGLQRFHHPQPMALALLPGRLCLCGENGLMWSHALQGVRSVDFRPLSRLSIRRQGAGGQIVHEPVPEPTAIVVGLEHRILNDQLLLATLTPDQAFNWVQLITVARRGWLEEADRVGQIHI